MVITCENIGFVTRRVEFSKPNIEISITVTKALKLRSFSRSYSHNFYHYVPQQYFFSFWQLFCTVKRVQKNLKKIILRRRICAPMQQCKNHKENDENL